MNNQNTQINELKRDNASLSPFATAIFIIVTTVLGTMSALPVFSVIFTIAAAALFAYTFLSVSHPALTFISSVLSAAVLFLVLKDFYNAAICVLEFTASGVAIALCIKNKASFYIAVAAGTAAFAVFCVAGAEYSIYLQYGSFIEGTKAFCSEINEALIANIKTVVSLSDLDITLTDAQIQTLISAVVVILPGAFLAVSELFAAAVYFVTGLIAYCAKSFKRCFPDGFKIKMSPAGAAFFIISSILALVCSSWEAAQVFYYAAFNILIVMFLPMVTEGIFRIVRKFKTARKLSASGNGPMKAPLIFVLGSLVLLLFINILLPFVFIAYYGALEIIHIELSKAISNKINKDS